MWKKRTKTTSFWIGLSSILVLIVDYVSSEFGFSICSDLVPKIILGLCSFLVLVGFVNKKDVDGEPSQKTEILDEIKSLNNYTKNKSNTKNELLKKSNDKNLNNYTNISHNYSDSDDETK